MNNVIDIRTLRPLEETAGMPRLMRLDNCPFCGVRWKALSHDDRRKHMAFDLFPARENRASKRKAVR